MIPPHDRTTSALTVIEEWLIWASYTTSGVTVARVEALRAGGPSGTRTRSDYRPAPLSPPSAADDVVISGERGDCRAFSLRGWENGSR